MGGNAFRIMDMGDPVWLHDSGDMVTLLGPEISVVVGILPSTSTR